MGKDEYATTGGSLKLKGVQGGKVEKKKKKKPKPPSAEATDASKEIERKDSPAREKEERSDTATAEQSGNDSENRDGFAHESKTAAEKKYLEMRRKRLNERLQREGVKTHKERVEELNKYLSNLSEHHDMPRIGPG
ncbi:DUF1754-domain-containing protein [Xylona heveae TC161]|uniref:DUF1754-domain-containing protein n=1 Tax=Xylona heveae (strain CBS 132557 / TC161) TaxID=1328760 RepID=A0A165HI61_XYLHT|nr:DUF1754-domain-containing protein [Xylona heveae TC161]KZF23555.1 DUF1754-domain-containing protein [Xylona heveae TC161]